MKVDWFAVGVMFCIISLALGAGWLVNKDIDNTAINAHIQRGANFYQAYCAVHEPRNLNACVESLLKK